MQLKILFKHTTNCITSKLISMAFLYLSDKGFCFPNRLIRSQHSCCCLLNDLIDLVLLCSCISHLFEYIWIDFDLFAQATNKACRNSIVTSNICMSLILNLASIDNTGSLISIQFFKMSLSILSCWVGFLNQ